MIEIKFKKVLEFLESNLITNRVVLAFSGGKDSCVIKHILKKYFPQVELRSIYLRSGCEGEIFIKYLQEFHSDIEIMDAQENLFKVIKEKGKLPTPNDTFCCKSFFLNGYDNLFKEGEISIMGVKRVDYWHVEENSNSYINENEYCVIIDSNHKIIYPLFDWTDDEVMEFAKKENIQLAPEYELGERPFTCPFCVVLDVKTKKAAVEMYPELVQKYKDLCCELFAINPILWELYGSPDNYWEEYINAERLEVACNERIN